MRLAIGEHVVAHPRHRQVGQHNLVLAQLLEVRTDLGAEQEIVIGEHHALRRAGSAGGIEDDRGVAAFAEIDLSIPGAFVAHADDIVIGVKEGLAVVPHAARVVVYDCPQGGEMFLLGQDLIDLFLILRHDECGFGVVQHEAHLLRHRILIDGHGNGAQGFARRSWRNRAVAGCRRRWRSSLRA